MIVGDICGREPITIAPGADLVDAAQRMRAHHVGFLVVTADGRPLGGPIGVLTDRDLVIEVVSRNVDPTSVTVEDAMTRDPLVIGSGARPEDALRQMRAFGVRRAPVVGESGGLVGVLALDDLLDWLATALADAAGLVRHEQRIERQLRA